MIKLTSFSPGAGCGCKISPAILDKIIKLPEAEVAGGKAGEAGSSLLVGNETKDDAAVYDLGNGKALISTTDFFMPICDDAFDFGRIASANAISDVYAMGGEPLVAISILGWPLEKLPPELAGEVLQGARAICRQAGIQLAGGHSIDSLEPIFGLAVTGIVDVAHLKRNNSAREGDVILFTKPLGTGILSTAQKKALLLPEHGNIARDSMVQLNLAGAFLGAMPGVTAMTDVTGFGLLGHLIEMCEGSGLSAALQWEQVPVFPEVYQYLEQDCIPGGTKRNWKSYGMKVGPVSDSQRSILCDPQTSGGLLVAVKAGEVPAVTAALDGIGQAYWHIGRFIPRQQHLVSLV